MIFDDQGRLVWFHPVPSRRRDRLPGRALPRRTRARLVGGNRPGRLGVGFGRARSSAPPTSRSLGRRGQRLPADLHDFQITPQGSAYLTAYSLVSADLSSVGGPRNGIVQDAIVQEVDIKTGLVMFEWHAYGHVPLTDSYSTSPRSAGEPYDYFHVNSISPDPWGDGNSRLLTQHLGGV